MNLSNLTVLILLVLLMINSINAALTHFTNEKTLGLCIRLDSEIAAHAARHSQKGQE